MRPRSGSNCSRRRQPSPTCPTIRATCFACWPSIKSARSESLPPRKVSCARQFSLYQQTGVCMLLLIIGAALSKPRPQVPTRAPLYYAKAWERYRQNDDVSAACYLRESIKLYLRWWCELDGIALKSDKMGAIAIYKAYCRGIRQKPCSLMVEVIDCCNRLAHLEPIDCEVYSL